MNVKADVLAQVQSDLYELHRSNRVQSYQARKVVGQVRAGVASGFFTLEEVNVDLTEDKLDRILEDHRDVVVARQQVQVCQ